MSRQSMRPQRIPAGLFLNENKLDVLITQISVICYKVWCFWSRFGNDLQISDKLFVMDAGASNSKDMKLLRSHLQELRASVVSVSSALSLAVSSLF